MSAPAVKPALPAAGGQAPKVGTAAPPAITNNPSIAGAPKVLPTTGNLNRPLAPPNANHAAVSAMPLSLVQDHKTGSGLIQQTLPVPRTPEKTKEHPPASSLGVKPTSNGVESSLNRPNTTSLNPSDTKKLEEGITAATVMNHSAEIMPVGATPSQPQGSTTCQPVQQNPVLAGVQQSPSKAQSATASAAVTNHSTILSMTNEMDETVVEGKSSQTAVAQPAEPPPTTLPLVAPVVTPAPVSSQHQQPQVQHASPQSQQQQQHQQQLQQQQSPTQQLSQQTSPALFQVPTSQQEVLGEPVKPRIEAPKPEYKVATPPRNSKRKREIKLPTEAAKIPVSEQDDRKSKRVRIQTQPYQSPLPELTYIAKLKTMMKSPDDKLIVFYKNEFLAVRNAEGSFYICQAMQNIYKSSPRIRIRWLSQEKKDNKGADVYIPDFYDATDFDCILTNLELKRLDKNKYQLPEEERERTQSILKRALDVEKGVSEKPPITEEHPDGLDLSLFRDESQLKKRRFLKRTAPRRKGKENASSASEDDSKEVYDEELEEEIKKKKPKPSRKAEKSKVSVKEKVKTKEKPVEKRAERVSERGRDRGLIAKRRTESMATPTTAAAKNAAVKQTVAKPIIVRQPVTKPPEKKPKIMAKITKKPEPVAEVSIPTRSAKTRNGVGGRMEGRIPSTRKDGDEISKSRVSKKYQNTFSIVLNTVSTSVKVASQPKSSPVTRTKERERRGVMPARGRKKPVKKA